MHKITVFIVIFTLGFWGCDIKEFYTVVISNESSSAVTYTYNGSNNTLALSEAKTYEVEAYTQPPKIILGENEVATVKIKYHSLTGDYTFVDKE